MNPELTSKSIRFAALIRVSTERQEKEGESLRAQRSQIEEAVRGMGGIVVEWYGGQEHAMPDWEKAEVARLISDAEIDPPKFDAVMVASADRWSRDNVTSQEGLSVFSKQRIRFFTLSKEFDLFKPEDQFFLRMSAVMGQFQAEQQSVKSINARIHRAKRGIPTSGKIPFGRIWNDATQTFTIDVAKKRRIEEIAARYLDGESLERLAKEYGMNHANLYRVLMGRSGTEWTVSFFNKSANVREIVTIKVPALLSEETIRAIRARAEANRTYLHGSSKNEYLFSRLIFCGHCNQAMFGCVRGDARRCYRHLYVRPNRKYHTKPDCVCCGPTRKPWINADVLEQTIMRQLFAEFGNPAGVQRAIEAATPNLEAVKEIEERKVKLETSLARVGDSRKAIIRLIVKGSLREDEASEQLDLFHKEEEALKKDLDRLVQQFAHMPSREVIESVSKRMAALGGLSRYVPARLLSKTKHANRCFEEMTFSDQQALVRLLFSGKRSDGGRMGIYVQWNTANAGDAAKSWHYTLYGHLLEPEAHTLITANTPERLFNPSFATRRQVELATISTSPRLRRAGTDGTDQKPRSI